MTTSAPVQNRPWAVAARRTPNVAKRIGPVSSRRPARGLSQRISPTRAVKRDAQEIRNFDVLLPLKLVFHVFVR
jgi:hypothetical protein